MKKNVIVVDDEPIIRLDLHQMLEELGYEVIGEASDGFDAVELCRSRHPDIVLLDLEMSVFSGMSAAETILTENLADCVVICTAFADEEFLTQAGQAGVSGYLVKPIEQRMLRPTLEVAYAQSMRLAESDRAAAESERRWKESRLVERAKGQLAQDRRISEAQAYREMQQMAMGKRTTIAIIAQAVLDQSSQHDAVGRAKARLMREKRLSEDAAYKLLAQSARQRGTPIQEEAKRIRAGGTLK